jgi:hypothetical protein
LGNTIKSTKNKPDNIKNTTLRNKQIFLKDPRNLYNFTPNNGNTYITIFETTFLIIKKVCTKLSSTKSNTKDFPTQDMLYPNPEMNLSKNIIYAFFI